MLVPKWLIAIAATLQQPLQQPSPPAPPALTRPAIERIVAPIVKTRRIPGAVVAIARGDSIVLLEAFGVRDVATKAPMRVDDLFMIGSVTKLFTATLLARLVDDRLVSLDAPLRRYLDAAKPLPTWVDSVTIRQLANHTAGLPRNPVNRRDIPNSPSVMQPYSRAEFYEGLARTRLASAPGTKWAYSNLTFAVLGEVIERASRRTYADALRTWILEPNAMRNTGVHAPSAMDARFASGYWPGEYALVARPRWNPGEVVSFAGMYSRASDLARFLAALSRSDARAPFSASMRTLLQTPTVNLPGSDGARMSLGWFIDSLPDGASLFGGGGEVDSFSSEVVYAPRTRTALVILVNRGGESATALYDALLPALQPYFVR